MSKPPEENARGKARQQSDDASLDWYLAEIGKVPLLSAAEELRCFQKLKLGDQKEREKLVLANRRFVVSIAKQYQGQGLALADLISEGEIGLIKAINRFDETLGFKLISYAVWWIRQSITLALAEQGRIVRLPANREGELRRQRKTNARLHQELGREPSTGELAEAQGITEDLAALMETLGPGHVSLDMPLADGNDETRLDLLEDTYAPSPAEIMQAKELSAEIEKALATLTDREAEVINLFFGIGEPRPLTLEEIGDRYSLTRERVRQIKERAIRRLSHVSRSLPLRRFLKKHQQ